MNNIDWTTSITLRLDAPHTTGIKAGVALRGATCLLVSTRERDVEIEDMNVVPPSNGTNVPH